MRRERSFLILVLIGIVLGAYIYFVERKRPAGDEPEKKPKVFEDVKEADVEEIIVKSGTDTTDLKKVGDKWQIVSPITAEADTEQVNNLLGNFSTLERNEVVEESASNLKRYGLDPPRADVAFRKKGSTALHHLLVGNKAPTGGDLYAHVGGEKRVILISGFMESVFVRSTFDLRDKAVLKFDRDKVEAVELVTPDHSTRLTRSATDWRIAEPLQVRADFGTADSVVSRLASSQMRALVSSDPPAPADLKKYGLDKPAVSATVAAGSARATLLIGAETDQSTRYAKDASRPLVFTVESSLLDDLKKPASDFRRKDLFEFRPFNATHIEMTRGGKTYVFDRVKNTDPKAPVTEKWHQSAPAARDVELQKMDSFLSGLSNLRVESWADKTPALGLDTPDLTILVKFDDGKKEERVAFAKKGPDLHATRGDEPGAAKVSTSDYDTAVRALDDVLK
ncbi:MAG: DUF4340 domain-containing protein [Acidobacteriota bacterium]